MAGCKSQHNYKYPKTIYHSICRPIVGQNFCRFSEGGGTIIGSCDNELPDVFFEYCSLIDRPSTNNRPPCNQSRPIEVNVISGG